MKQFDQTISFTINTNLVQDMKRYLKQYPEDYENMSHLIRCAIIRLLHNRYETLYNTHSFNETKTERKEGEK